MKVQLLGTGSADGWPNPFCTCASCGDARRSGLTRGQTGVLVDDRLLIDCGPEIPAAAGRHGVDLGGVRTMLFTHGHPDHVGPGVLLFRHWAGRDEPLDVFAPREVLALLRDWIAPTDPVALHAVVPGDVVTNDGYTIGVLSAEHGDAAIGGAVLFDVSDAAGSRLLFASDTGPLPEQTISATTGARYDIVLLEETFGDHLDHGTSHLDLSSFPDQVRRLRAVGAIDDRTDLVAVHLSHHNPPSRLLDQRLRPWGARTVLDGAVLTTDTLASGAPPMPPAPNRTLVLGGARSGKSLHAEELVATRPRVTYVATAPPRPDDPEWAVRVAEHRSRRPSHWSTVETADVPGVLRTAGAGEAVLVDCLTLWLTRVLDESGAWDGDLSLADKHLEDLLDAWRRTKATVVAVSNEVGQGIVPATRSGRMFRDLQGRLNAAVAAASDDVVLMTAGRPVRL